MKAKYIFIIPIMALAVSCKSSINPEMREEMEAIIKLEMADNMVDQAQDGFKNYSIDNLKVEVKDIEEKRFEFKGDEYGTFTAHFSYSFEDKGTPVKILGTYVFSHDCSPSIILGDKGFFIDAIFVGGSGVDIKTSKYNFARKDN